MKKWKETELRGYINVVNGFAFKSKSFLNCQTEGALPVVKIKNVANGDVNLTGVQYHLYEEKFLPFLIEEGDVLVALTGNHPDAKTQVVGAVSLYKMTERSLLNQRVAKIIPKQGISKEYLYYFLKDEETRNWLAQQSSGSANQANISKKDIEGIPILIPSLSEQLAIASVLSSLDDKIDLLHRQNATLEKMAETLFRQWFVEEAKEEWKEICLDKWVKVINGISYKSSDLNSSKTAMVTLKSFNRNGGFRMDGFKEFTGIYKENHLVYDGDVVVAHTDLTQNLEVIGSPAIVMQDSRYDTLVFSMDLVKVVCKHSFMKNEFLYLLLKSREFKEHALGYANGSTVIHLSKNAIPEFEFKAPPLSLIVDFNEIIIPLFNKMKTNQQQILTLTSLRDTLLPKLMSGEVRVEM